MALLRSNAYWIFRSTSRNGANGTEETKKKRPGMQSTGDWDNPEPLRPRSPSKGSRNRANGTEEVKKKRRKSEMQSTGGWDIPKPPAPLPKGVEAGLTRLRKSRKRDGSRECKVREVGTSLTRTPPKNVLYVLQRFFCPVGDERSLIVILLSDTWISIKLESFKDQVLVGCTN